MSGQLAAPTVLCDVRSQRGGTGGPTIRSCFRHFPAGSDGFRLTAAPSSPSRFRSGANPQHVRPQFLAGTRQVLYRVTSWNGRNNPYYVTSLDSPERKLIGTVRFGQRRLFRRSSALHAEPQLDGAAVRCQEPDGQRASAADRRWRASLDGFTAGVRRVLDVAGAQARVPVASGELLTIR